MNSPFPCKKPGDECKHAPWVLNNESGRLVATAWLGLVSLNFCALALCACRAAVYCANLLTSMDFNHSAVKNYSCRLPCPDSKFEGVYLEATT